MATRRYTPKTRIICTLGPASSSETVLRKMMQAGMDIARINFSHGTRDEHARRLETVRKLNRKYRRRVRILGDLEGPRIRLGFFDDHKPIPITRNHVFQLTRTGNSSGRRATIDYPGPFTDLADGGRIFIDDGNIVLDVRSASADAIKTRIIVGGVLKERKALNIPGAKLRFPPLTEKDREDLEFAVEQQVDYLALSFVQKKSDILTLRDAIGARLPDTDIVAKIESRPGVQRIEEVMDASDAIMIARGDMGVSLPVYEVPSIQKDIIRRCRKRRRMVITATQMLEHMVDYPMPTRAEATDVANAVLDGTNCVMLSAETAVGQYPVETVQMMNQIIKHTELSTR